MEGGLLRTSSLLDTPISLALWIMWRGFNSHVRILWSASRGQNFFLFTQVLLTRLRQDGQQRWQRPSCFCCSSSTVPPSAGELPSTLSVLSKTDGFEYFLLPRPESCWNMYVLGAAKAFPFKEWTSCPSEYLTFVNCFQWEPEVLGVTPDAPERWLTL